jgi:hypothetical protein
MFPGSILLKDNPEQDQTRKNNADNRFNHAGTPPRLLLRSIGDEVLDNGPKLRGCNRTASPMPGAICHTRPACARANFPPARVSASTLAPRHPALCNGRKSTTSRSRLSTDN